MAFFTSAIATLSTIVTALGGGMAAWGAIQFLQGHGADNPAQKSSGMNQIISGGGLAVVGLTLIPLLGGLF